MFGDDYDDHIDPFDSLYQMNDVAKELDEEAEELNRKWEESIEFRIKNGDCGPQGFSQLAIALALMDPPF